MSGVQDPSQKPVLVCGLGRLGQHCAALLKEMGIPVYGLNDTNNGVWEIDGMPHLLDRFTLGDCRRNSRLEEAGVRSCRAVLFTTDDERVNVSGALTARALNPDIRLVIRSSQANLNEHLNRSLNNLMMLDIAELPATAFSLAAIGGETVGLLSVDDQYLRVVETLIGVKHPWLVHSELEELNTRRRRVLHVGQEGAREPLDFHGWHPRQPLRVGDLLAYVEFYEPERAGAAVEKEPSRPALTGKAVQRRLWDFWSRASATRRAVMLTIVGLALIHVTGVVLYKMQYPETSLLDAFNVATVLIFDGYSNMFAQLKLPFRISLWMLLFSLLMTMSGAVVMGMIYAFLTARVLSARLEFRRRPGRVPAGRHMVVIGLDGLGRRVARMLAELKQPVVGLSAEEVDSSMLPGIPIIRGEPLQHLSKANCETAASILTLTNDDVTNLEFALAAKQLNPNCRLVVRADDVEFGHNLTSLAPHTHAISIYALAAEAFAAGALGERVLSLLRIGRETVLTIEFLVEPGDSLADRLLVEVTCGYGLVAILHQRQNGAQAEFFPPEDIRLKAGDRLVVLATIGALQNVEHGNAVPRDHQIRILSVISDGAAFEGARLISRTTGCPMGAASTVFRELPTTLPNLLFRPQAERLVRDLMLVGITAEPFRASTECAGAAT